MEYVKIGGVQLPKTAMLAPMASIADTAYRIICRSYGASYTVSEMVSAKALCYGDKKSFALLKLTAEERPAAIQLFGNEPETMAKAAKLALAYSPLFLDVNMGCPVPKIAGNGCGSALMKTPQLAADIVSAMKAAVDLPVTVKFRKGWDDHSVNAVEFAVLMEQAGADAVTVHGRTKAQMYRPPVDLDIIRRVKEAVKIPVIGNGGITDAQSAKEMYEKTGCDLVAVAQGSYGRPWIFEEISRSLNGLPPLPEKSLAERLDVMLRHISLMVQFKGEEVGMREARTQAAFYIKGSRCAARFRNACSSLCSFAELQALVLAVLKENEEEQL